MTIASKRTAPQPALWSGWSAQTARPRVDASTRQRSLALGPDVARHHGQRKALAYPTIAQLLRKLLVLSPGYGHRDNQATIGVGRIRRPGTRKFGTGKAQVQAAVDHA